MHLTKSDGTGDDSKPARVWTQLRLPTKIHESNQSNFSAASVVQRKQ